MIATLPERASQFANVLDPSNIQIDGQDSRDRLAFVAAFARLILYYNHDNQVAGNWQSFFIKDPTILLAWISKTDYESVHGRFVIIDQALRQASTEEMQAEFINQLCRLISEIFASVNQWVKFLERQTSVSHLRQFLEKTIRETLAVQLCLLMSLQQRLANITRQAVAPPDTMFFRNFEPLWYERAFNLTALANAGGDGSGGAWSAAIAPLAVALQRVYHVSFKIFMQIIEYARQAFYPQERESSHFPDTALMIVFSRLMESQKDEINKIGRKHLDFYYERVLLQHLQPAMPDQVYVSLRLAQGAAAFTLPAATPFRAGQYPDQSEILFCSEADEFISQALISSAYTLFYGSPKTAPAGLTLSKIAAPDQVNRDALQEIVTWDAFGNTQGLSVQQGFALASPMLLLQGGDRIITITLNAQSAAWLMFPDNRYYLSTEKDWFQVFPTSLSADDIVFHLKPDDPAIVAFKDNPDGYSCSWPLFKVVLGTSADLQMPPSLEQVCIAAKVSGFAGFSLANDLAPLAVTAPQAILGPVPQVGSRYFVGSNECLAKPLESLTFTMAWDQLPLDFADYYAAYNNYLAPTATTSTITPSKTFTNDAFKGQWKLLCDKHWDTLDTTVTERPAHDTQGTDAAATPTTPPATPIKTGLPKRMVQGLKSAIQKIKRGVSQGLSKLLKRKTTSPTTATGTPTPDLPPVTPVPIETTSQTVSLFQQYVTLKAGATTSGAANQGTKTVEPPMQGATAGAARDPSSKSGADDNSLSPSASTSATAGQLCPNSIFTFRLIPEKALATSKPGQSKQSPRRNPFQPQPSLALAALPPVNSASNGYFCFELGEPVYAFGNSLYAKVVAQVSLENAQWLIQQARGLTIGKIFSSVAAAIKKILSSLFGKSNTAPVLVVGPQTLPNLPWIPRQTSIIGTYQASATVEIGTPAKSVPYPLELFHYGSFKPYLAYSNQSTTGNTGEVNLVPKALNTTIPSGLTAGESKVAIPLVPGVSGQGCLYVSISGIQAPCTLTLFAEISVDESQAAPTRGSVGYFYWSYTGWQAAKVLHDDTDGFSRTGILRFDIQSSLSPTSDGAQSLTPTQQLNVLAQEEIQGYTPSPIMPNQDFWLAIATTVKGINAKLSYLDTQTLRLARYSMKSLPPGQTPQIVANTISQTKNKVAQIASIVQPFPSFGGRSAEQKNNFAENNSFYRRVSARLNNKDRAVDAADFVEMAQQAYGNLYCARELPSGAGAVRVGLVNSYADAQQPNAFRPNVDATGQQEILDYLTKRASAQTQVEVVNLNHQVVTVQATLMVASSADLGAMKADINQALRVYLSPWIKSSQPQITLGPSLNQSALVAFLTSRKGVISVAKARFDGDGALADDTIFVSAAEHVLTFDLVEAGGGSH